MKRVYWISCAKFTARAVADENDIVAEAAPIAKAFVGQPVANLLRWAARLGGLQHEEWDEGQRANTSNRGAG